MDVGRMDRVTKCFAPDSLKNKDWKEMENSEFICNTAGNQESVETFDIANKVNKEALVETNKKPNVEAQEPVYKVDGPDFADGSIYKADKPDIAAQETVYKVDNPDFEAQETVYKVDNPDFEVKETPYKVDRPDFGDRRKRHADIIENIRKSMFDTSRELQRKLNKE